MPPAERMREALCRECSAAIYWITLQPSGAAHPVDYLPAPFVLTGLVVVNPATSRGRVLTNAERDSGAVYDWLDKGAQVHASHFSTCPAAESVRHHNPNQEAMDV